MATPPKEDLSSRNPWACGHLTRIHLQEQVVVGLAQETERNRAKRSPLFLLEALEAESAEGLVGLRQEDQPGAGRIQTVHEATAGFLSRQRRLWSLRGGSEARRGAVSARSGQRLGDRRWCTKDLETGHPSDSMLVGLEPRNTRAPGVSRRGSPNFGSTPSFCWSTYDGTEA